jgi:hypothetical protein
MEETEMVIGLQRKGSFWAVIGVTVLTCVIGAMLLRGDFVSAAEEGATAPEPVPPSGQTYTGAKKCAACHFEQYMAWKKDKHSKSFDLLTDQYKADPKCLKCHTTGYGEATGYKGPEDTNLAGTTCESCHGPGSKHDEICQQFAKQKLNAEQEKVARDSIWLMLPKNVCATCHTTKAHKESETPKELRKQ